MSKNIIIQEGGTGKQMSVSKLKTNTVGGGTCLWVPEDEASLGTKSITSNGTYNSSDDGKYGYSQVTVNVPGGQGSANPDGTPSSGGGTPSSPSPSSPGGPGSGIVGTDPDSGNDVFIGVDSDGNIVTTPLPSTLEIVTNPTTTEYNSGDPIDTTGAVVVAKNADGTTWTSSDYPDGIIPLNELELSTNTAELDEESPIIATSDSGPNTGSFGGSVPVCGSVSIRHVHENPHYEVSYIYTLGTGICLLNNATSTIFIAASSSSPAGYTATEITIRQDSDSTKTNRYTGTSSFTFDGKTVYYIGLTSGHDFGGDVVEVTPQVDSQIGSLQDAGPAAWVAVYGSKSGGTSVSMKWNRPADNKELSVPFNITVDGSGFSEGSEGSESGSGIDIPGGGSSEDSGGSNSGGGDNF